MSGPRITQHLCILAALSCATNAFAIGSFDIHLNAGPNLQANPEALGAFERAAQQWESYISSPIRINIDAEIAPIGAFNVIGSTDIFNNGANAPYINQPYSLVRDAMAARHVRPGNEILAYLPTSAQVSANVPAVGAFDNTTLGITTANQKALGLMDGSPTNTWVDAGMTFNSNFSFDYDRTNGVQPGQMDFETVAAHEIGHVLGFLSDTDDYDYLPSLTDNATTLDLFRFNHLDHPATAIEFTTKPRELRPGHSADFFDLAREWAFSTGVQQGDGSQASHWRDEFSVDEHGSLIIGNLIGIMDPSLNYGVIESISEADLRAMELIGYDTVVPEPAAFALIAFAFVPALARRRRR